MWTFFCSPSSSRVGAQCASFLLAMRVERYLSYYILPDRLNLSGDFPLTSLI